ncbi:phosphoribosylamine--glycine ligase [Fervidicoccus fontis]|uniref:phosphoribosylamine--glycine ligase n=1 Tax=Fervidicoccus fontis TaxID=683846 RepID=A0A843AHV1_9CREN|nr:phosphoribosylamine--glycine ligase [Fervidicoccus fontis]MBE9391159.1 phosphoribosylamine--glycine ligase [Fervidicoccus fontis]
MRVLIVGSGAREHALAKLFMDSTMLSRIYVFADYLNPGLKRETEKTGGSIVIMNTNNAETVREKAKEVNPDLIVIGGEEPLFMGVSDALREEGFFVFGASRKNAMIEQSKVFARSFMWRNEIPGRLFFQAFKDLSEAEEFMKYAGDVVVKPARQAGGKGVRVIRDTKAYLSEEKSSVKMKVAEDVYKQLSGYDDIDYKILLEQRAEGVEYTLHVISDGFYSIPLPIIQDHAHAFEYDIGPETGGMGCISGPGMYPPFLTKEEFNKTKEIVEKVLENLKKETKEPYVGVLAGQMMLTWVWGPTVIEFYSRFGDPEISALLPLVEGDFLEFVDKASREKLSSASLKFKDDVSVVVKAIAPLGYPLYRDEASNHPITIDEKKIRNLGCEALYGSVEQKDGKMLTKGSRAIEIVCYDSKYEVAYEKSEKASNLIEAEDGWPLFYRSDIGSLSMIRERTKVAERMRRAYKYREKKGLLGEFFVWLPEKGIISNPLLGFKKVSESEK